jgi:hypothetical protein
MADAISHLRLFAAVLVFVTLLHSPHLNLAQFTQQRPKLVGTGAVRAQMEGGYRQTATPPSWADPRTPPTPAPGEASGTAWVHSRTGGVRGRSWSAPIRIAEKTGDG